jgi:hypothetical protein
LVARLKKTLEVENGVGIAAPQVGISKNIFLFMRLDLPDKPVHVAVNPKIVHHPDTTICRDHRQNSVFKQTHSCKVLVEESFRSSTFAHPERMVYR